GRIEPALSDPDRAARPHRAAARPAGAARTRAGNDAERGTETGRRAPAITPGPPGGRLRRALPYSGAEETPASAVTARGPRGRDPHDVTVRSPPPGLPRLRGPGPGVTGRGTGGAPR